MGEIAATGEPAAEVAVDGDATMQDMPVVVLVAEVGLSVEVARMMARDAMEELLGIWSDGKINGYIEPSLAEITWYNYQEMCKLHESLD